MEYFDRYLISICGFLIQSSLAYIQSEFKVKNTEACGRVVYFVDAGGAGGAAAAQGRRRDHVPDQTAV